ncbi:MAG: hypothetical protein ABSB59_32545 [Streptosporangiaceae bacterium]
MGMAQAPPGEGAGRRAAGRRDDVTRGALARPALRLVGGFDAAQQDPVEQDLVTPFGEQRPGGGTAGAGDRGRRRHAGRQDGPDGQVTGEDPGAAAAADQGRVVRADRDGGSGRDGDGHVLEAGGHDGHGSAAVRAVDGEETGDAVDRLDHGERTPTAQAGVDRPGPIGRAEAVTGAEHDEPGTRAGAELGRHPEGAGGDVGGVLLPGIRSRDDERHDRTGGPGTAQVGIGRHRTGERVRLVVHRDAALTGLGGQLPQRVTEQVSPDLPGLGQAAGSQQHGQVRLPARAVEAIDEHGVPPGASVTGLSCWRL